MTDETHVPGASDRIALPRLFDRQRGALFPWIPVCLALGIGLYFALPREPSPAEWQGLVCLVAAASLGLLAGGWRWPLLWAAALMAAGLGLAGVRTAQVAGPVLDWRYYGPVEGRIVEIDRSGSDKPRLTLDNVVLRRMDPAEVPRRVRVSLHGDQRWLDPVPGQTIIVTAHLGPPEGPVEPGGFDFQRHAWFEGLGAVGYARTPALLLEPPAPGSQIVGRMRSAIAAEVREVLPGPAGGFAVTITTGDRSGLDAGTMDALRDTNLAHLLAISGLHMGLMTGVVFMMLRTSLALIPGVALSWPTKKVAAAGALAAGAFYLALSGGNVATQRAFIMAAVMLVAVMLDRRALTFRSVAVAAIIVLILRPEALTGPGFQMSFAATIALVAVFRALRGRVPRSVPRWVQNVGGVVVSSAVAGAATAPVAAAHFNQMAQFGLIANLLSVPLMGAIIMPAAVLAAALSPFGLHWIGLWLMKPGILWILGVAEFFASLDAALIRIPSPSPAVLPIFAMGALVVILWQGRGRWLGVPATLVAGLLWLQTDRPDVLISPSGGLVGIATSEGRALNKDRGDGFAARVWLENDGTEPDQELAAGRAGFTGGRDAAWFPLAGRAGVVVAGRGAAERAAALCAEATLVVTRAEMDALPQGGCALIDVRLLRRTGSLALHLGDGVRVRAAHAPGVQRAWHQQPAPAPEVIGALERKLSQ